MLPKELGVIAEMLAFQKTGQKGAILTASPNSVSEQDLRDVSVHLLEWLRASARYSRARRALSVRPLSLGPHPWSRIVAELVDGNPGFAAAFEIADNALSFRRALTVDAVQEVLAEVETEYNPPLMNRQ